MLTATVTVNLDHEEPGYFQDLDYIDRHALQHVESIPNGAHLIIVVGARRWPTNSAVTWLKPHIDRLDIELVAADSWAARRWLDAIKSGEVV